MNPEFLGIPRRDLILLPLISLGTVLLMTAMAELVSRQIWPEKEVNECDYAYSATMGQRRHPNCASTMKNIEGPWVRYQFNDCGYRGKASCGPKPPGTLRVAVLGTSVAFGLHVPYDQYFLNQAAPQLAHDWGHPVELQNLGDVGLDLFHSDQIPNEALGLKPDAIFFIVVPFDLNRTDFNDDSIVGKASQRAVPMQKPAFNWAGLRAALRESRFLYVAQHFMLQDSGFFLRAYAAYVDPADVSLQPTPPLVEFRLNRMDTTIGKLADRAHSQGVPLIVLALPNRVQSALVSRNINIPNIDPYVFANHMKDSAQRHRAEYIDMISAIRNTPNAEQLFYSVDGHPNGRAHALMSQVVVDYFRHRRALCPVVPQESLN